MPGDSLYWSPAEADSDDSFTLPKEPYIDPWDLENYAYIREQLDSMELSSNRSMPSGSSSGGEFAEANCNSFYYVPGEPRGHPTAGPRGYLPRYPEDRRGYDSLMSDQENYVAIDEIGVNERRRRSEMHNCDIRRRMQEEYESETDVDTYGDPIIEESPVFGIYDEKGVFRRVALPITYQKPQSRDRSISYAYGDNERDPYASRMDLYSRLDDYHNRDSTLPIYDDVRRRKPDNFGLSQQGHLKIDYSCSWNNLNKYMRDN
ncbi:unnamed protein product [Acanthoscelides obtectus]|uniref:Uncharacterized protein n=1 Tax=Acanthoscelides obtectus TaxID=200917 RepID=A0A9P0P7L1_ACAOB|nr:unnamed protein product [Acanthoscelides obtectus]CAK1625701.1 hypothetical protein AOBTE_LOCUS3344 [Acanthoscelides obtectus]